jgi:hypothetical protein
MRFGKMILLKYLQILFKIMEAIIWSVILELIILLIVMKMELTIFLHIINSFKIGYNNIILVLITLISFILDIMELNILSKYIQMELSWIIKMVRYHVQVEEWNV